MRSSFRMDSSASRLIDEYFSALDELARAYDDVATADRKASASTMLARGLLEKAIANSPSGVPSGAEGDTVWALLLPNLEAVPATYNRSAEVESRLRNSLGRILGYIEENYAGLPRTARNLQAADEAEASASELKRKHAQLKKQDPMISSLVEFLDPFQKLASIDPKNKKALTKGMAVALRQFEAFLAKESGVDGMRSRNAFLQRYRDIGVFVQSTFSRPQDLSSAPRTDTSRRHTYTVTYPRGWVEWTPELSKHLPMASMGGLDMHYVRTGFFGDDRPANAVAVLTTRAEVQGPVNLTDQLVTIYRSGFELSARKSLPAFRVLDATRTMLGQNPAILLRATYLIDDRPAWIQSALIFGSSRSVEMQCTYRISTDIDECTAIARSVHFN